MRHPTALIFLRRLAVLLATSLLAAGSAGATGAAAPTHAHATDSTNRPHQPSASQAGGQAVREAKAASPARLQERAALLEKGEAALVRLDVAAALDAFERAALILHAADTEIALVRSYMQAGDYRRALAFGAHTAGAHLDVTGGSLLYAWLLHVGGQPVLAQRLLAQTGAHLPGDLAVQAVQAQLRSGAPRATGLLLALPTRLAPYGDMKGLPGTARVVGSAVLLSSGRTALAPHSLLPRSGRLWLRNGLGQLVKARAGRRLSGTGVSLVHLEHPLPVAEALRVAASDAFPGSAGFAVEYVNATDAMPAWPVLRTGFLGAAQGDSGERLLGIEMPAGARGGPVFDGSGRLTGLALPGAGKGGDRLVAISELKKALGEIGILQFPKVWDAASGPLPRGSADVIYEGSLKTSLQVITTP